MISSLLNQAAIECLSGGNTKDMPLSLYFVEEFESSSYHGCNFNFLFCASEHFQHGVTFVI